MQGQTAVEWRKLCEQAAVEQNPDKLMKLIREITRLLQEKEQRLKEVRGRAQQ
jgi:hypothetical protein